MNNHRVKAYNSIINTSYLKFYMVSHLLHLPSLLLDFLTIWKRLIVIVVLVFFLFLVLVGLGPGRGNPRWPIANLGLHVGKLVSLQSNDGGPIILFTKKMCMIKAYICTGTYTCQAGLAESSPRGLDSSWVLRPTRQKTVSSSKVGPQVKTVVW